MHASSDPILALTICVLTAYIYISNESDVSVYVLLWHACGHCYIGWLCDASWQLLHCKNISRVIVFSKMC